MQTIDGLHHTSNTQKKNKVSLDKIADEIDERKFTVLHSKHMDLYVLHRNVAHSLKIGKTQQNKAIISVQSSQTCNKNIRSLYFVCFWRAAFH